MLVSSAQVLGIIGLRETKFDGAIFDFKRHFSRGTFSDHRPISQACFNFSVRPRFKRPFRSIFVYSFSKKALYIRWCINDENSFNYAYDMYAGSHDQDFTSSLHVRLQCQARFELFSHRISNNTRNRTRLCTLILRNLHRRHNGCALCFVCI